MTRMVQCVKLGREAEGLDAPTYPGELGQRIFATAPAFETERFYGKVVHIEQTLGRKNFRTFQPTEKTDTKILEVVIALEDGRELPLDLQMTVWFLDDPN